MLIKNKIVLSFIFIFSVLTILAAKPATQRNLKFSHLTLEDGLSQSMVLTILQDSRGFMWFGTEDGLNRYDGYDFKIYRNNPDNQNSLSNNYIQTLFEDREGFIWIGTYGGGINIFDPDTEQFTCYKNEPNNSNSLSNNNVKAITQDRNGDIWIGTYGGGLNKFDQSKNQFINFRFIGNETNSLNNDYVFELLYDSNGFLWIGTIHGGLYKLDIETGKFVHHFHDNNNINSLSSNSITAIIEDRDNAIWVGTLDAGINKLISYSEDITNEASIKFQRFITDKSKYNFNIWDLYQDNNKNLWIGTSDGILNMDTENGIISSYKIDYNNPHSVSDNEFFSIYQDRSEILWFGTAANGIDLILPSMKQFELIQNIPDNDNSLNFNTTYSIFEDDNNFLWIGTGSGGLNLIDKYTDQTYHYKNNPNDDKSISHNRVHSIFEDSNGNIWLGTGSGLNRLEFEDRLFIGSNRISGSDYIDINFIKYLYDDSDPHSISGNNVIDISEDKYGNLWIGTYSGLNYMDPISGKFDRYLHNSDDPNTISSNMISDLYFDHNNTLWIGTWDRGLNKLVINDDTKVKPNISFIHFRHNPENSQSLSSDFITYIFEDVDKNLWIGTNTGLNKFDYETESFKRYTIKDGLPNNVINGLLGDSAGFLWISTNKGLSKFDYKNEIFINYNKTDGLQDNEFNKSACFKSKNGELFFGGISGLNSFYPKNIHNNPYLPPIVITDFKILNESVSNNDSNSILSNTITTTKELELSYKDKILSFEFASLNFIHPEENKYAYMMEGFDSDWIYSDNRRFVTYTNLDPGDYIFKVKGSNDDNIWNEEGTSIKITIIPPIWKTSWFRLLAISIIIGTGTYLYKKRINKIEAKKRELQIRVKEKTKAASDLQKALNKVEELKQELNAENIYLQEEIKAVHNFENIITKDKKLKAVLGSVEKVSSTDSTVLILGESGTGKELIARAIHNISNRKNKPLVKVNCAALPANLVESELFGHEKGAFTGAISKKIGRFELAHKGTIFLDEIGDLDLEVQAKLLRVLQEGEFERLGSNYTQKVDVRLITATNRDLEKSIDNNTFRSDLYFRLNVFPITMPPLRDRKSDIPLLTNYFVDIYGKKIGKKINIISKNIMDTLMSYSWPGNIRELENIIERAVIISPSDKLVLGDWFSNNQNNDNNKLFTLEENEKVCIKNALEATGWRISGEKGAAKILGLKPTTLEYRIKKLGIKKES